MAETPSFAALQEQFAQYTGQVAGIYGATPLVGRLYGILFLAPRPMTLDELAKAAGSAKSTASVALRKLEALRMVQRQWLKGDRRDYYTAQTDFAALIRAWFDTVFQHEFRYMGEATALACQALQTAPEEGDWPASAERKELLRRLQHYDQFCEVFMTWMNAL